MASDNEACCESDPNFAVICAFLEKFGVSCGLANIDFLELQGMLENTQEVSQVLIDLHIKLLRRARKSVSNERWERAVIKFCHTFCTQDAWELERFGYKKARISSKLRILKELLEMQFDCNGKFKTDINKMSAVELRSQPLGRDKYGHAYWFQSDENYQIRVYKEDLDEETWTLVAKDRDGLVTLITDLGDGDSKLSSDSAANEDSNSLSDKPIIDTGQVDSSDSKDSKKSVEDNEDSKPSDHKDDSEETLCEPPDSRPTLRLKSLSELVENEKRPREDSDEDDETKVVTKKPRLKKDPVVVGEAIEEPVMKVQGEGSGEDNESPPPIVGDEIVESVFYVFGEGSGADCQTGNNENQETKQTDNVLSAATSHKNSTPDSISDNSEESKDNNSVPTYNTKNPYKLGTIIDIKTDKSSAGTPKSPTKRSRWDVEATPSNSSSSKPKEEEVPVAVIKPPMFFFGKGSMPFKSPFGIGFGHVATSPKKPVQKAEENHHGEETLKAAVLNSQQEENESQKVMETSAVKETEILKKDIVMSKEEIPITQDKAVEEKVKPKEKVSTPSELEKSVEYSEGKLEDPLEKVVISENKHPKISEAVPVKDQETTKEQITEKPVEKFTIPEVITKQQLEEKSVKVVETLPEKTVEEKIVTLQNSEEKVSEANERTKRELGEKAAKPCEIKESLEVRKVVSEPTEKTEQKLEEKPVKIDDIKKLEVVSAGTEAKEKSTPAKHINPDAKTKLDAFPRIVHEEKFVGKKADTKLVAKVTTQSKPGAANLADKEQENLSKIPDIATNLVMEKPEVLCKNPPQISKAVGNKESLVEASNSLEAIKPKQDYLQKKNVETQNASGVPKVLQKPEIPKKNENLDQQPVDLAQKKMDEPVVDLSVSKVHANSTEVVKIFTNPEPKLQPVKSQLEKPATESFSRNIPPEAKVDIKSNAMKPKVEESASAETKSKPAEKIVETVQEPRRESVKVADDTPSSTLAHTEQSKAEETQTMSLDLTVNVNFPATKTAVQLEAKQTVSNAQTKVCTKENSTKKIVDHPKDNSSEGNKTVSLQEVTKDEVKSTSAPKIDFNNKVQNIPEVSTEKDVLPVEDVVPTRKIAEEPVCEKKQTYVCGVPRKHDQNKRQGKNTDTSNSLPEKKAKVENIGRNQPQVVRNKVDADQKKTQQLKVKPDQKPLCLKQPSDPYAGREPVEEPLCLKVSTYQCGEDDRGKTVFSNQKLELKVDEGRKDAATVKEQEIKKSPIKLRRENDLMQKSKDNMTQIVSEVKPKLEESTISSTVKPASEIAMTVEVKPVEIVEDKKPVEVVTTAADQKPLEAEVKPTEIVAISAEPKPIEAPKIADKTVEIAPKTAEKKSVEAVSIAADQKPIEVAPKTADQKDIIEEKPIDPLAAPSTKPEITVLDDANKLKKDDDDITKNAPTIPTKANKLTVTIVDIVASTTVAEPPLILKVEESQKEVKTVRGRSKNKSIKETEESPKESVEETDSVPKKTTPVSNKLRSTRSNKVEEKPTEVSSEKGDVEEIIDEPEPVPTESRTTRSRLRKQTEEPPAAKPAVIEEPPEKPVEKSKPEEPQPPMTEVKKLRQARKSKETPPPKPELAPVVEIDDDSSVGSPLSAASMGFADNSPEQSDIEEIIVEKPDEAPTEEPVKTKPLSLATFSMDFTESPAPSPPPMITRALRKRGRESPGSKPDAEESAGKRIKLKGKRVMDAKLRKSIEQQKEIQTISSGDEDDSQVVNLAEESEEEKPKLKRGKKKAAGKNKKEPVEKAPSEIEISDEDSKPEVKVPVKKAKKDSANKNKRILSNLGVSPDQLLEDAPPVGIRQSRRLAQLKIREQMEVRKLEDKARELYESSKKSKPKKDEDKDYKAEKRKRSGKVEKYEEEEPEVEVEKKKKKKKWRDPRKIFDEKKPWKSSSDSSSAEEEEEEEIIEYEEEETALDFKSDHEFSPESDLEDGEWQPLKRARTARKESDVEEVDDCPCQKCGKSDHPEWILLCDKCDNGWHCSCLRPPLLVIPEGDWFCPPCQHFKLLESLQMKLIEFDKKLNKKEIEDRRKERLAYVGISLNHVLPSRVTEHRKKRRRTSGTHEHSSSGGSHSNSSSGSGSSESESDSDEPIYQLRQRRQAQSYKFNDYDELIKSAIQDEMEAVKGAGNQGRGKDISTIVNAEREEGQEDDSAVAADLPEEIEPKPPVVPKDEDHRAVEGQVEETASDEEVIRPAKKLIGRKKHRKLNSLDISSEDDADSDEDFKGTSTESEEDEFDDDLGSDSDDVIRGGKRRKNSGPVRRSTRARVSRYDTDFINDDTDDDEAPRRKKKRSIWDESESEESDRSWGRRKKRPNRTSYGGSRATPKKKKSKKKKKSDDSDVEMYRGKKPKIKYGGLESSDEEIGRRTRGKKTTYIDTLGSDSEDEHLNRNSRRIESDEDDEYVANEEEEDEEVPSEEDPEDEEAESEPLKVPKIKLHIKPPVASDEQKSKDEPVEVNKPAEQPLETFVETEPNPIEQINKNLEEMDEVEMEKMMEEEEYANKQLQMVALQLEKEKKRKELEAAKLMTTKEVESTQPKKRGRKPKNPIEYEPIVSNVAALIHNDESNDELSEPPGVALPLFAELASHSSPEDSPRKRRGRGKAKKTLEETLANLGSARGAGDGFPGALPPQPEPLVSNIEIAAPPQPFSQSQPTPSVITRMLQAKNVAPPGNYAVGSIRPKQFATMAESDAEEARSRGSSPTSVRGMVVQPPPGQFIPGGPRGPMPPAQYRLPPPGMSPYPRSVIPHQLRGSAPLPPHMYHPQHRPLDPSPSGGGPINMADHPVPPPSNSPNKSDSPASYSRAPAVGRFPLNATTPPRPPPHHMLLGPRPGLYAPPNAPPGYYGGYHSPTMSGSTEDALPPSAYQGSPYAEPFAADGQQHASENSNSKSFDEESGGEFGGLVSYFSSQREDDLES